MGVVSDFVTVIVNDDIWNTTFRLSLIVDIGETNRKNTKSKLKVNHKQKIMSVLDIFPEFPKTKPSIWESFVTVAWVLGAVFLVAVLVCVLVWLRNLWINNKENKRHRFEEEVLKSIQLTNELC